MVSYRGKLCVLMILLLSISTTATAADGFNVNIVGEKTTVTPSENEEAVFRINVTNTGNETNQFRVSYNTGTATNPGWYYLDGSSLTLEPGESEIASLYVSPDNTALSGSKGPEVVVYESGETANRYSELVTFKVRRDNNLVISNYQSPHAVYRPGETINISMTLRNVIQDDIPANQYQAVLTIGGTREVEQGIPAMEAGEAIGIRLQHQLAGYPAGLYDMTMTIEAIEGDTHSRKTARFEVARFSNIDEARDRNESMLGMTQQAITTNNGNTVQVNQNVTMDVAWYIHPFVSFETEPDSAKWIGPTYKYTWTVSLLEPGDSVSYELSVNYWPLLVIIAVLLAVGYLLYVRFRSVRVVKKVKEGPGKKQTIHLSVKNNTGARLEQVAVEDFVPGIASLIEKFDGTKPDSITSTDDGTKLVWHMDGMNPEEERIITYTIEPKIQVEGAVSLPAVTVHYSNGRSEDDVTSHPVTTSFE